MEIEELSAWIKNAISNGLLSEEEARRIALDKIFGSKQEETPAEPDDVEDVKYDVDLDADIRKARSISATDAILDVIQRHPERSKKAIATAIMTVVYVLWSAGKLDPPTEISLSFKAPLYFSSARSCPEMEEGFNKMASRFPFRKPKDIYASYAEQVVSKYGDLIDDIIKEKKKPFTILRIVRRAIG